MDGGGSNEPDWEEKYYQLIVDQIYRQWQQPTKAEVGNPNLSVKIMLIINKSGGITAKRITKISANSAMDNSCEKASKKAK